MKEHITVCICTYKRPDLLKRALEAVRTQSVAKLFTFSIVVVDNDRAESARAVVAEAAVDSAITLEYFVQPQQNIALARNLAVEKAKGDYIAFLDDDEFPLENWLLTLFTVRREHNVDGVLGPVKPFFSENTPKWVVTGNFYNRTSYPTGMVIDWRKGRTGNVLLKREVFDGLSQPFRPEFRVGEDQDFFRRMIEKGRVFIWCDEALALEWVPPVRWNKSFMLRRALLRGAVSLQHPTFGLQDVVKSLIAVPAYVAFLPFSAFLGPSNFMTYLIKLFDHLGRLLAVLGMHPVKGAYVTE